MAKGKGGQSEKSEEKPTKNLSKVAKKPRVKKETMTDRMAEMVDLAFMNLPQVDGNGVAFITIKKYIAKTFFVELTKPNQTMIKKIIGKGFRDGRIEMTNDSGNKINYSKRFQLVDVSDMEDMEDIEDMDLDFDEAEE